MYGLIVCIENIRSIAEINMGQVPSDSYNLYNAYTLLVYVISIDIMFSLLLISSSVRIDQIFYRLKWVSFLITVITITISIIISILAKNYPNGGPLQINLILFIVIGLNTILLQVDNVLLYIKYKNNPFYHNGKIKKVYTTYTTISDSDSKKTSNEQNIDKKDVLDQNISYLELYEKRSQELHQVEEDFDNKLIDEKEYERRRKEIYAKYDKYN